MGKWMALIELGLLVISKATAVVSDILEASAVQ
jgi:hypothetical protein